MPDEIMTEASVAPRTGVLANRIVRYSDLMPCFNAFIDTRTPGSDRKENFTIIGPGVSENSDQLVHIAEPHGFNIGGARQPPGCVNSQHSHDTAETFVVHTGRWRFVFGEEGQDASIIAKPGDLVSFPTQAFRGFENVGVEPGFLWSVLGGDDPGRVTWAPSVFALARAHGLVLLENGALIDTAAGQKPPAGIAPMRPTDTSDVARLRRISQDEAAGLVYQAKRFGAPRVGFGRFKGVIESPLIGAESPAEGLGGGIFDWPHGYQVRRWDMAIDSRIPDHQRSEPEVLFVHEGILEVRLEGEKAILCAGDTVTIPAGSKRGFGNSIAATVFVVHGGDEGRGAVFE